MNDRIERLARKASEASRPHGNWSEQDWEQKNKWRAVAEAVVAEDRILLGEEVARSKAKVAS